MFIINRKILRACSIHTKQMEPAGRGKIAVCTIKIQFLLLRHFFCELLYKWLYMQLKMFIAGKLVDATEINAMKLHIPGYIHSLRMEMEETNEDIIDLSHEEPEFFIETVPSSMNISSKLFTLTGNSFYLAFAFATLC